MNVVVVNLINVIIIPMMSEPAKACPIEVDSEGRIRSDQDINPHIELLTAYQKRIHDIPLDDITFSLRTFGFPPEIIFPLANLLQLVEEENSFSLTFSHGFHDPDVT